MDRSTGLIHTGLLVPVLMVGRVVVVASIRQFILRSSTEPSDSGTIIHLYQQQLHFTNNHLEYLIIPVLPVQCTLALGVNPRLYQTG